MKKIYALLGLVVAILVGVTLISNFKVNNTEIVVGATLPVTGNYAYKGQSAMEGLLLAQEEINEAGGINGKKLKVIVEDNKGEPKEAVLGVNKLLDVNGAKAIMASFSNLILAVTPIIKEKDAILIYASTVDSITKQGDNIFKDYYSTYDVGQNFALAARQEGLKKVGVLTAKSEWGDEFANGFASKAKEIGLEYVVQITSPQATDFKNEILKFRQDKVDGLAVFSLQNNQILKLVHDQAIDVRLFMAELLNDSIAKDSNAMAAINDNMAVSSWYYFDSRNSDENSKRFIASYNKKFGVNPRADAAYSYDDLFVLRDVLTICDKNETLNKQCLIDNLKLVDNYNGVSGTISFGSDRISNRPLKYYIYKNNEWREYVINR
jgi:branched-chain amino acid transport system substrate-binding protein